MLLYVMSTSGNGGEDWLCALLVVFSACRGPRNLARGGVALGFIIHVAIGFARSQSHISEAPS